MTDTLVDRNDKILLQLNPSTFRKRVKSELDRMYPNYDQIDIEITDKEEVRVTIYKIEPSNKLYTYGFIVPKYYPFRPPAIFYQNRPYIDFLRTQNITKMGTDIFRKVTGQRCFCCSSFNCGDNWKPGITLEKIIEEIRFIKRKKRDVVNKLMADKIKARYLVVDIDLDSWLY